jgi:hypothetical protein
MDVTLSKLSKANGYDAVFYLLFAMLELNIITDDVRGEALYEAYARWVE